MNTFSVINNDPSCCRSDEKYHGVYRDHSVITGLRYVRFSRLCDLYLVRTTVILIVTQTICQSRFADFMFQLIVSKPNSMIQTDGGWNKIHPPSLKRRSHPAYFFLRSRLIHSTTVNIASANPDNMNTAIQTICVGSSPVRGGCVGAGFSMRSAPFEGCPIRGSSAAARTVVIRFIGAIAVTVQRHSKSAMARMTSLLRTLFSVRIKTSPYFTTI